MSGERFCSQCGTARQKSAGFCVACGKQFDMGTTSSKIQWLWWLGGILAAATLVYLVIFFTVQKGNVLGAGTTMVDHDHSHPEDSELQALEKKAIAGSSTEVMQLVGYLIEKGKHDRGYLLRAAEVLETLVTTYPDFALGQRTLGNLYYDLDMPVEAEPAYKGYLTLYPKDANYRTDYGTVLLTNGQTQAAIEQYKQAMAIHPDHYHAAFNLSIAYQKLNDSEQSKHYRKLAEDIESRVGKTLAPEIEIPQLPNQQAAATTASSSSQKNHHRYQGLEAFFRNHEIISRKMTGFSIKNDTAILSVSKFPMETMPPYAREVFDKKVWAQMALLKDGEGALEIRDSDNGTLLATYKQGSEP